MSDCCEQNTKVRALKASRVGRVYPQLDPPLGNAPNFSITFKFTCLQYGKYCRVVWASYLKRVPVWAEVIHTCVAQ